MTSYSKPHLVSDHLKKSLAFEMRYNGEAYEQIAAAISVPASTLTTYLNREWRDDYSGYADEQDNRRKIALNSLLKQQLTKAATVLIHSMDNKDPRIRLMAAKEVLDRAIGKPAVVDLKLATIDFNPVERLLIEFGLKDINGNPIFEENDS
jgi:hypothetical protein